MLATSVKSILCYVVRMYATKMSEVKLEEARRFMEEILMSVGAPERAAKGHADLLLAADSVGHNSHGLNRLKFYVNDIKNGACCAAATPIILRQTRATAWVDACNTLGATTGHYCMDLAIKKAQHCGVAWVSAKNCSHNGMASYWAVKAERKGFIGLAFTNTQAVQVPTRSKMRALGTNPIAMVAPAANCDRILIDLATSTVALGKIEVAAKKNEPIPHGWALGEDGKSTTDAKAVYLFGPVNALRKQVRIEIDRRIEIAIFCVPVGVLKDYAQSGVNGRAVQAGLLLPLGGEEKNSGYKGYALAAMVEILCGALSGSNPSHKIPIWSKTATEGPLNIGHSYAAINPSCFAPGFTTRLSECLNTWRNLPPVDPERPVLAPGDMERMKLKVTQQRGTVFYPQTDMDALKILAEECCVKPLQTVKLEELRRFIEEVLASVGTPECEAKAQADLMIAADSVGHYCDGIHRLKYDVNDIKNCVCCPAAQPKILKETDATAWVDACHSLGATSGNFCMDLAIEKAKNCGLGWISAKHCSHNGMAGYWGEKAERHGYIGLAFTNAPPIVVPTRAKKRALGSNPIAMVAPAENCDRIMVDLATSNVAMGRIEYAALMKKPIPEGWALGPDGKSTTDSKAAAKAAMLMPLGGLESNSGFKGYAIGTMVEVFCSGLSGSNPSHKVPYWNKTATKGPLNLGQCFVVINPGCFAPGFTSRVSHCLNTWRNLPPANPQCRVIVPGDLERRRLNMTKKRGSVAFPKKDIKILKKLAEECCVKPLELHDPCG
ncbi:unnamed protein product [Chrysodeixis includens]|uniref:Malate dehydrogenase n=1 Tax=Chrysodeixis includens TaxID=689277 RepID=A0A9N8KYM9_CHRIL|nr:unnamed protein product [Chrysodeixis includens]